MDFERGRRDRQAESYTGDLWAAAYIINGGCSDDWFEYFRSWLVAQGETVYTNALRAPETLQDAARPGAECEPLLRVADAAYDPATGQELSDDHCPGVTAAEPTGVTRDDATVDARYPHLVAKFAPYMPR